MTATESGRQTGGPDRKPLRRRRRGRRGRPAPDLRQPVGRTYPLKWVAVALAATAVVLIGGPWIFFSFFDGSTPGRLQLPAASGVPAGPLQPGPVTGTWVVSSGSQVGYRVHEVLFGASHTAVGRTSAVSGGVVISGTEVTAADFTVKMSTIKSDQAARDFQFRNGIMDTNVWPTSSFRLTSPIKLGSVPAVGKVISVPATGDLTLRGVKRSVTFELSAERLSATAIDLNADIPIAFPEWKIPNPSLVAGYVASVADSGTLEVLLDLSATTASGQPVRQTPRQAPTTTAFTPGTF